MTAPLIDHAFVINLDRDVRKWSDARRQFNELNIEVERWSAVNGWQVDRGKIAHLIRPAARMNPGEVGCCLSHLTAWQEALRRGYSHVAIFEDDARTQLEAGELRAALLTASKYIGEAFDVLYLGKCCDRCDKHIPAGPGLVQVHRTVCMHAYVISTTAIRQLLSKLPTNRPIDELVAGEVEGGALLGYAFHPSLFVQAVNQYQSALREAKATEANVTECLTPLPLGLDWSRPWQQPAIALVIFLGLMMLFVFAKRRRV